MPASPNQSLNLDQQLPRLIAACGKNQLVWEFLPQHKASQEDTPCELTLTQETFITHLDNLSLTLTANRLEEALRFPLTLREWRLTVSLEDQTKHLNGEELIVSPQQEHPIAKLFYAAYQAENQQYSKVINIFQQVIQQVREGLIPSCQTVHAPDKKHAAGKKASTVIQVGDGVQSTMIILTKYPQTQPEHERYQCTIQLPGERAEQIPAKAFQFDPMQEALTELLLALNPGRGRKKKSV